jgi:arylsulfatase A-like enzyme
VPARADILTGRYTWLYQEWGPLSQNETTLPQCLSQAGYSTFGIADTPFLVRNGYGHDRGFDDFIHIRGQRHGPEKQDVYSLMRKEEDRFAPQTLKGAADWLERHYEEKFFLYIDTWDPHEPWNAPDYYVKPYSPEYSGKGPYPVYWDYQEAGLTDEDIEIAHACYCGEISMVDRWFGFLMERIRTLGILEDTAILFTSDHGFSIGEHGQFGKSRFKYDDDKFMHEGIALGRLGMKGGFVYRSPLHNEITQIPMLLRLPGEQPRRIPGLVGLPDLMPTFLELAGAEIPETVQAKSIMPLVRGECKKINDIIVTTAPFKDIGDVSKNVDDQGRITEEISPSTITDGEWDLLYGIHGEPVELYRTKEDPGHQHNVFEDNRHAAEALHEKYIAWLKQNGALQQFIDERRKL